MSRNSNDDRSNSMNPNNDAYHASEANRNNQIGAYDNDDVELSDSEKQQRAVSSETQSNAYNRGIAGICDALLSISQQTQNEKAENTISRDGLLLARTTLTESSCGEDPKETWGIHILNKEREMSSDERALNLMCQAMLNRLKKP